MSIKGVTKSMTFDLYLLHFFDGAVFYLYYSSYPSQKKKKKCTTLDIIAWRKIYI